MIQNFELIKKEKLTHNVYELEFEWEKEFEFKSWQFITFIIEVWGRAYSILKTNWNKITLIIKKRELSDWGRWWSKYLCELSTWDIIKWVWPAWHFVLKNNDNNKIFFGTWTWFVPLYNQIINWLNNWYKSKFKLIFWAREEKDLFYIKELNELKNKYQNFDFDIYTSNENNNYHKWYVTDYISNSDINNYNEAYLCWIPIMIDSAKEKLLEIGYKEENIFTEKY